MNLTVLGSGGPLTTPRPSCRCRVCEHARQTGGDSWRSGPAIFVHDARLLIDAPGDALQLLTRAHIDQVDHLFISHWHPDHTEGFRFVEQLNYDLKSGLARRCTDVWMNDETAKRLGADWRHFEQRGYCRLHVVQPNESVDLGAVRATWFNYADDGMLSGFLLTCGSVRVLLTVDETSGLHRRIAAEPTMQGCDLLIAECGWFESDPTGRKIMSQSSPHRDREASFERDTLRLLLAARAKRTVLIHLMDLHGHTPVELDILAARLSVPGVQFARDGLTLAV